MHSMTAYGFGEAEHDGLTYTCEIRTLNSRFLEVSVRMPRGLIALEIDIINHMKANLRRGKVDVFLDAQRAGVAKDLPVLDTDALKHYDKLAADVRKHVQGITNPSWTEVLRLEGVIVQGDTARSRGGEAAEVAREPIFRALTAALEQTRIARAKEGQSLAVALLDLTRGLEKDRLAVAQKRDDILAHLHKGYLKRLDGVIATLQKAGQPVGQGASDERLLMEIAILSDKADIEEELTRLATHVAEFDRVVTGEEGQGRKLDFLCQEMHREVNTMSNKLVQTDVAQHTIEMKQAVERIRQQVQNIE